MGQHIARAGKQASSDGPTSAVIDYWRSLIMKDEFSEELDAESSRS